MEATARNLVAVRSITGVRFASRVGDRSCPAGRGDQAITAIEAAIRSNQLEGDQSRSISGVADRLCADLERMVVGEAMGIKALCRRLRPILKAIDTGHPSRKSTAIVQWREIHGRIPAVELARPGVRRELGVRLSAVMDQLLDGATA